MGDSTATIDGNGNLCLGPRVIPPPRSISAQAQKFLSTPNTLPTTDDPPAHEKEAWRKRIARFNAALEPMADQMLKSAPATVETKTIAGVTVHVGTPNSMADNNRGKARIDLHGGGMVFLAGKFAMQEFLKTFDRSQFVETAPVPSSFGFLQPRPDGR